MPSYKNVRNLNTLETEIYKQKLKSKMLEDKIGQQFHYLQDHYASMLVHSLFKRNKSAAGTGTASVLQAIWQHEKVQETVNKMADSLVEKAAEKFSSIFEHFRNK
jgi:hypothetical protein